MNSSCNYQVICHSLNRELLENGNSVVSPVPASQQVLIKCANIVNGGSFLEGSEMVSLPDGRAQGGPGLSHLKQRQG